LDLGRLKAAQHILSAQALAVRMLFGRGFLKHDILLLFACISPQKAAVLTVRSI
jgi:hypothetical protein